MRELDTDQVEQLKKIGATLREEREKQQVPLQEVAVKTYIPLRLLQALEVGQIERLPEPVFIQGFIRRYGDVLGLDGSAISKKFIFEPSPSPNQPVPAPEPVVAAPPQTFNDQAALDQRLQQLRPFIPYAVAGGLTVLVFGIVATALLNQPKPQPKEAVSSNPSSNMSSQPQPNVPAPSAVTSPQAATKPTTIAAAKAPASTTAKPTTAASPSSPPTNLASQSVQPQTPASPVANLPVQVSVNAKEEAWVWVDVDGKTVFEGMLKKGDQKSWSAQKTLTLGSGNAGGVTYTYNQGAAKTLGKRGVTQEVTLPAESTTSQSSN